MTLSGAHITLLPQLKSGEERRGIEEVFSLFFPFSVCLSFNICLLQVGWSNLRLLGQVLGERVEFEVVRAGPSYPIRYWRGQEAVYRWQY